MLKEIISEVFRPNTYDSLGKWRYIRFFMILLLFIFFCFGCPHIEPHHLGVIKDAETKEPLKNVVVSLEVTCVTMDTHTDIYKRETLTNDQGEYKFDQKFLIKPPCTYTARTLIFFKEGYFIERYYDYSKSISDHYDLDLFQMTHFLDFLPYQAPDEYFISSLFENKYAKLKLDLVQKMELQHADDEGVFMRLQGRKLGPIYTKQRRSDNYPYETLYWVYDEIAGEWLIINSLGRFLGVSNPNLPKWDFMTFDEYGVGSVYANSNAIFYQPNINTIRDGVTYKKGEIKKIIPFKGDILALAGDFNDVFTIEGNGKYLCYYKGGRCKKSFVVENLPDLKDEKALFTYIIRSLENHFIVVKSIMNWHIYKFHWGFNYKTQQSLDPVFKPILSFPVDEEINAIAYGGDGLYIAFKNEGLKKYVMAGSWSELKEDSAFSYRSKQASYSNICSITAGSVANMKVVYATTGEDKIYRFSSDGTPDYQLK